MEYSNNNTDDECTLAYRRGQVDHCGRILDPNVRRIPDDLCNKFGLPVQTLVKKYSHPFFDLKDNEVIPTQFWELMKMPHFNGLTKSDVYNILLGRDGSYNKLLDCFTVNKEPWKDLRKCFVQSHPDTNPDNMRPIIQWLYEEMTRCLDTFYELCDDRNLYQIHDTDVGNVTGYAYAVMADASDHESGDYTVCITLDVSHAKRVAEYLCTAVSLMKRGLGVEIPADLGAHICRMTTGDISIHRVPIMTSLNLNHDGLS